MLSLCNSLTVLTGLGLGWVDFESEKFLWGNLKIENVFKKTLIYRFGTVLASRAIRAAHCLTSIQVSGPSSYVGSQMKLYRC